MMQVYPVLVAEIAKRGIKKKTIAESLGVCGKTLSKKINGKTAFLWPEVRVIQRQFFPDMGIDDLFSMSAECNRKGA